MDQFLSNESGTPGSASPETMARIRAVLVDSLHWHHRGKELSYEQMLDEAAALDSIAALEFFTAVEREFGIKLEAAVLEFEFLRDIAALASYVEDRLRRASKLKTDGASVRRTSE